VTNSSRSAIDAVDLALGDIFTIPGSGSHTVRAVMRLEMPFGAVAGFVVLGEFEIALAIPALQTVPASVCGPRSATALKGKEVQVVAEGAARYWPPHRPAVPGAMTPVKYRVVAVRGQESPVLVCFRGPEPVIFAHGHSVWLSEVVSTPMGLGDALDGEALARRTGEVLIDSTQRLRPAQPAPAERRVAVR
jgi:hypothetical protein